MADETVRIILPDDASPDLIERIRDAFPDAATSLEEAAPAAPPLGRFASGEEALARAAAALPRLPEALADWWAGLPGGGLWFLSLIVIALAAGYAAEFGARRITPTPETDRETGAPFRARLPRGLRWLLGRLVGIAFFGLVATVVARAILPTDLAGSDRAFARGVLYAVMLGRAVVAVIGALCAPNAPGRRLMGLHDAEARRVLAAIEIAIVFTVLAGILRAALDAAAPGDAAQIPRLLTFLLGGGALAWFFLRVDRPISALLTRTVGEARGGFTGFFARRWAYIYVAVVALDMVLKMMGSLGLLGPAATGGSGPTILILTMTPLAMAGLSVWRAEGAQRGGFLPGVFVLAEGVLLVAAAVALLKAWGVDPFAPPAAGGGLAAIVPGLVEGTLVGVVGFAFARTAMALLGGEEGREEGGLVDEEKVGGGTRMDTILPILRAIVVAAITVLTVLMALTALGVNIGPLLAGAGVLGLAIGFGAQRLVADVISGLFYLYEDAFRIGEYIQTGSGKGVVEKIGLRSVRLRHHRGPVFTIPFSDMGTIQNHSRDWVKIKFTFLVPAETDVEMVRKLVKKVGQQLEEDPELEGKFLEPLKSQGAVAIQGRSFEIGCKFTSRPGQQFLIRRKAYAALQKALSEKGIELFAPQLTINPADPGGDLAPAGPDGRAVPAAAAS